MCLVLFARNARPGLPLVVLANRDESFARPASASAYWADAPHVLAGRDLEKGGTWLGVTRAGRFACVTNVRAPEARREGRSRGALVAEFLASPADDVPARAYIEGLSAAAYPSFNALFFAHDELLYARDHDGPRAALQVVQDGVHGLSNARLDEPWPKVTRGVERLARWLDGPLELEAAFGILGDREGAETRDLPRTGVPPEVERALAPAFVALPGYGTRASTVVVLRESGELLFAERSYGEDARILSDRRETLITPPRDRH